MQGVSDTNASAGGNHGKTAHPPCPPAGRPRRGVAHVAVEQVRHHRQPFRTDPALGRGRPGLFHDPGQTLQEPAVQLLLGTAGPAA